MLTLHLNALDEKLPMAIRPEGCLHNSEIKYVEDILLGKWLRVFPANAYDVFFLQSLVMHVDKFAPHRGHGVLVRASVLPTGLTR